MIFTSVAWALLCVCLSLTAPVSGGVTKLVTLTREDLGDTNEFRLIADFEADSKPEASWWWYSHKELLDPPSGSLLSYGRDPSNPKRGSVSLRVPKDARVGGDLHLNLGDLDSHTFEMAWNLSGSGRLSLDLDLPLSTVSQDTDLAYAPGEASHVTIAVPEVRGKPGAVHFADLGVFWLGVYIYEGKYYRYRRQPVKEESKESKDGVTTTSVTFRTDQYAINGVFDGGLYANIDAPNAPIFQLSESITVKVHEDSTVGPFPDGVVIVRRSGSTLCYRSEEKCMAGCFAYGNDLESAKMYKEDQSGQRTLLPSVEYGPRGERYRKTPQVRFIPTTLPSQLTIVCEATLKTGEKAEMKYVLTVKD